MTNTVDELLESLVAATVNNEVKWSKGTEKLEDVLEEVYGNTEKLYFFFDEEEGSNIVLATYKYYEGEVEADEFLKDGTSLFVIDADDYEILNEVTDEDADDAKLFTSLMDAIEETKQDLKWNGCERFYNCLHPFSLHVNNEAKCNADIIAIVIAFSYKMKTPSPKGYWPISHSFKFPLKSTHVLLISLFSLPICYINHKVSFGIF